MIYIHIDIYIYSKNIQIDQSMTDINKNINHMLLHSSYQQRQKKERGDC